MSENCTATEKNGCGGGGEFRKFVYTRMPGTKLSLFGLHNCNTDNLS